MATISTYAETQKPIEVTEEVAATTETTPTETIPPATTEDRVATTETATPEIKENESAFSIEGEVGTTETATKTTPTSQPTFNLDEEIKKVDRKELAKKLGFQDFTLEMDDYLAKGGKAEDYLNAKSIDYNKIPDEDLVKGELKKKYPGFDINELFLTKYKDIDIADETDADRKRAELQLRMDAFEIRQAKIEQQKNFKIPDTPILQKDEAYEQWKSEQESRPQLIEKMRNYFTEHQATKTLHESKRVTINLGDGVDPFNFNIDKPELITRNLTDGGETWEKLTSTETGEPDVPKQQLISLFAFNPQKFIQDIFKYGVSTGERKLVADGQNAQRQTTPVHSMTVEKPTYRTGTYGTGAAR